MRKPKPFLTKTMLKILSRHASGLNLKEVAKEIFVSYSAVTNTVYEAKQRTETKTIAELVMKAHSLGYLSHPTGPDATVVVLDPIDSA
jgi:DNA-binding NarL/FixJ family response regulator